MKWLVLIFGMVLLILHEPFLWTTIAGILLVAVCVALISVRVSKTISNRYEQQ